MSAQPEESVRDARVPAIPETIDAVGEALTGAKRLAFYGEIGSAEAGEQLNTVLRKWWMEAMFDSVPGREQRLADEAEGRNMVPLPDEPNAEGSGDDGAGG